MISRRERNAWHRNLRWIAALLTIWFLVTFVVSWFARELRFPFFGWSFSFWMGAQGALVIYVLMAAIYAWAMNRADDAEATADAHADAGATKSGSRHAAPSATNDPAEPR